MSELKVNKISPETGTAITLGDSGDTFTVPSGATIVNSGTATGFGGGGKVLQVVSTTKLDTYTTSTASWGDVTGMSVSLTPASGTKCLVLISMTVNSAGTAYAAGKLLRDSTDIAVGTAVSSRPAVTWNFYTNGHNTEDHSHSMNYLDTHGADGSTAVTYKLQFNALDSSALYINRNLTDADNNSGGRTASSITVMEIGA